MSSLGSLQRLFNRSVATAVVLLVCAPFASTSAQRITLVGGLTFSKLRGVEEVKSENRNGTLFGVSFNVPTGATWSLQPEALFISKGGKLGSSAAEGERDIKLDYVEIPVLVRRNFLNVAALVPHVYAGPTVSFNVNCSVSVETNGIPEARSDCMRDDFKPKTLDWGAAIGAGVDLSAGRFGITAGARYGIGIANILDDDSSQFRDRVRNGTLAVYAGFKLGGQ